MSKNPSQALIPAGVIEHRIYLLRTHKVMLDHDLAHLYGVGTRVLNQAVKRNRERFPEDFMFQLTSKEAQNLRSQIVTSRWGGRRYLPYAFTEQGVAMLSSVLNSKRAIQVNIPSCGPLSDCGRSLPPTRSWRGSWKSSSRNTMPSSKRSLKSSGSFLMEPRRECTSSKRG